MLLYNGLYHWKGWGGKLQLASGKCRMRIYDLTKGRQNGVVLLKSVVVVLTDEPREKINDMTIKSCASHIATSVTKQFSIDPERTLWAEFYPQVTYGKDNMNVIPEKYEAVEFTWHDCKAVSPKWRLLESPLLDMVRKLEKQSIYKTRKD
jgi:hypothetical protein